MNIFRINADIPQYGQKIACQYKLDILIRKEWWGNQPQNKKTKVMNVQNNTSLGTLFMQCV